LAFLGRAIPPFGVPFLRPIAAKERFWLSRRSCFSNWHTIAVRFEFESATLTSRPLQGSQKIDNLLLLLPL
jgi:hypothetical protein